MRSSWPRAMKSIRPTTCFDWSDRHLRGGRRPGHGERPQRQWRATVPAGGSSMSATHSVTLRRHRPSLRNSRRCDTQLGGWQVARRATWSESQWTAWVSACRGERLRVASSEIVCRSPHQGPSCRHSSSCMRHTDRHQSGGLLFIAALSISGAEKVPNSSDVHANRAAVQPVPLAWASSTGR